MVRVRVGGLAWVEFEVVGVNLGVLWVLRLDVGSCDHRGLA